MNVHAKEFNESARRYTADLRHRELIQKALAGYYAKRDEFKNRFQSWAGARDLAAEIKWEAINHLDRYLDEFVSRLEARGTKVFWAPGAQEARDYIVGVARQHKVRSIIKSKSMTAEEIHLNDALEKAGFEVGGIRPGRIHRPASRRAAVSHRVSGHAPDAPANQRSVPRQLGSEPTNNPEDLTMVARRVMRRKYCKADMGISGANFAIAETGMISITENEGNARLTTSLPKIHVALVGIEKVLPRLSDLALFLPMLATAGAGQSITCYNTLYGGPRQPGEPDGPEEFHVVLLDNRRTELLADAEQRDALHCIRCGACLNVCPIFKNIGGHSYGTTYQGPIGSVITPHLRGLQDWKHLSQASSLCGACTETCPVKINLHHHLLHNRRNAVRAQPARLEKFIQAGFRVHDAPAEIISICRAIGRIAQPLQRLVQGTFLDPLRAWTKTRSFPPIGQKEFPRTVAGKENAMTNREIILGRIREALKVAAPHPSFAGRHVRRRSLPPGGSTKMAAAGRRDAGGTNRIVPPECGRIEGGVSRVRERERGNPAREKSGGRWRMEKNRPAFRRVDGCRRTGIGPGRNANRHGYAVNDLESCDAGTNGMRSAGGADRQRAGIGA